MIANVLLTCLSLVSAPSDGWQAYARPEEAGFDPARIERARERAEATDSAAVLAVWNGHVLAAWGDVERRFRCHSVRKSFLSALFGPYVESGAIDLEATLKELEIDDLQGLTAAEQEARVVDLLGARSGIYHPAAKEPADMRAQRPARGSHPVGSHWWYNNWDFNTLSTVFRLCTGEDLFEAFQRRIAEPIGMEDFRLEDGFYQLEPSRSRHPAYAFRVSARDLARFGQLFLDGGRWNGKAILSAAWVEESTAAHSVFEGGAYGFMWWRYEPGALGAGTGLTELDRHDKFAARGTGGQFLLVVPDRDFVFVHRGDTDNDRHVSGGAIWQLAEELLAAQVEEPLPEPELVPLRATPFADPGPPIPVHKPVPLPAEALEELPGEYEVAPQYAITIFPHDDRLFLQSPEGELELFCEGEDRYFAKGHALTVGFERDEQGRVVVARAKLGRRDLVARRR